MDNREDRFDPDSSNLADFARDALNYSPPAAPSAPRDAAWLRRSKYASLILVPAVVVGGGFLFVQYAMQIHGETYFQRSLVREQIERDTVASMWFRFLLGASLGGGLGLIYVIRCIVRRVDP
jgi:hypothetical protein